MDEMNNMNVEPQQQQPGNNKKGMSIASLVRGLISVVFSCVWYIAIPGGIVGIILAAMVGKEEKTGITTAGLVLSIVGLAIAIIWLLGIGALILGLSAM